MYLPYYGEVYNFNCCRYPSQSILSQWLVWVKCRPWLCIQPPKDTSPWRRGKSSYSPSLPPSLPRREQGDFQQRISHHTIEEFDAAVAIQRFWRNLFKRRLKQLRLQLRYRTRQAVIVLQCYTRGMLICRPRQRFARTKQLLRNTSDYTSKLLQ